MRRICGISLAVAVVLALAPRAGSQKSSVPPQSSPFVLTTQLPLPGVHGRFDHFAFDPVEPGRIFISALGNNSVEILNLVEGT